MGEFRGYVPPEEQAAFEKSTINEMESKKPEQKGWFDGIKKQLAIYGAAAATTVMAGTAEAKPRHQEHGKHTTITHVHKEVKHVETHKPYVAKRTNATLNAHNDHGIDIEARAVAAHDLTRFEDQEQLLRAEKQRLVVRVPDSGTGFYIDDRVGGHASKNEEAYRYARPYTLQFIEDLGQANAEHGGDAFKITSLVRTIAYQKRVARHNSAAGAISKTSHVTGATFDIAKSSVDRKFTKHLETILLALEKKGLIQATKEKHAFHIMVMPEYRGQVKEASQSAVKSTKKRA